MKPRFLPAIFCLVLLQRLAVQCPINKITTDPNNYQNASDPSQSLNWDWTQSQWYILLYYVSSCKACEIKRNVFVSDDQLRQASNKIFRT